jgi:hypothetical protein
MNINKEMKAVVWVSFFLILVLVPGCSKPEMGADIQSIGRSPVIQPDYTGIVIPSNIAPLNFFIKETGIEYFVRIHSRAGDTIKIQSSSGSIQIPGAQWKRLLEVNRGEQLVTDIFVKNESGRWTRFDSVVNRIAQEPMDGYLVYRKFYTLFNLWKKMGIYQRSLESFDERAVYLNSLTKNNCVNCHNFWQNGTDRWLLHLRAEPATAMLMVKDGKVRRISTKTEFNGHAAYPSWHPSGDLVAFSVSNLLLFFHETGECRDVLDRSSDIIVYDIPTNTITTDPQISSPDRLEIWPAWSPDGKTLYFCSAPKIETYVDESIPGGFAYDKIKYDLMKISYDPEKRTWGNLETVISANTIGLSITEPRVSPDGRFVLFTAAKYSQFPIYLTSADVYLLDIRTGRWKKLEVNSDRADSFHSWSSNSRWIVFSSKRQDGLFARPHFSFIDSSGIASKPFVLPQEDPLFYETCIETYNVPEFTKEPVHLSPQALADAAFSQEDALSAKLDPNVMESRTTGNEEHQAKPEITSKQNAMKR